MSGWCPSAFIALALLSQSSFAQGVLGGVPGPNAQRFSVSGTVINSATGEPIRRAVVRIQGAEPHLAFTGEDGRFQIDGVPQGFYLPNATRPGFEFKGGAMINVGPATEPVTLKMDPQCFVQGHIVDEKGEPLENVFVRLIQFQIVNGHKRANGAMGTTTDEDGDYEIEDIPPGKYLIHTNQTPVNSLLGRRTRALEVYPERFYPDAPDQSAGQVVELQGGQTLRADFKLSPVPAFRVRGTVAGVQGYPNISVEDASGQQMEVNGGFEGRRGIWNAFLPNGSWTIVLEARDPQGNVSMARLPVNVANSDVDGLNMSLQPVPPVAVHITAENQQGPPILQVKAVSRDNNATEFYARYDPRDESAPLAFIGIESGSYAVYVSSNGNGCIDSIQSGGADLSRSDLVVAPGSGAAPIEIAEREDCASVTFSTPSAQTAATYNVILTSNAPAFEPRLYTIQPGGTFAVNGLTPGNYNVYTVADATDLEYANPEALRGLSAQELDLGPNSKAQVTIGSTETAQVN